LDKHSLRYKLYIAQVGEPISTPRPGLSNFGTQSESGGQSVERLLITATALRPAAQRRAGLSDRHLRSQDAGLRGACFFPDQVTPTAIGIKSTV
jgi:hypothetical protein